MCRGQLCGSAADARVVVAECFCQLLVGQFAEPLEGTQRGGTNVAVVAGEPGQSGVGTTLMAGDSDVTAGWPSHCFNRSVRVITANDNANEMTMARTAPITMAMPELAATAHTRRITFGRL